MKKKKTQLIKQKYAAITKRSKPLFMNPRKQRKWNTNITHIQYINSFSFIISIFSSSSTFIESK